MWSGDCVVRQIRQVGTSHLVEDNAKQWAVLVISTMWRCCMNVLIDAPPAVLFSFGIKWINQTHGL